jgi:hypothetical protein
MFYKKRSILSRIIGIKWIKYYTLTHLMPDHSPGSLLSEPLPPFINNHNVLQVSLVRLSKTEERSHSFNSTLDPDGFNFFEPSSERTKQVLLQAETEMEKVRSFVFLLLSSSLAQTMNYEEVLSWMRKESICRDGGKGLLSQFFSKRRIDLFMKGLCLSCQVEDYRELLAWHR